MSTTGRPLTTPRSPRLRAVLAAALVGVVSGCSFFRGVVREAELASPLDPVCVEEAVARTEGVSNVRVRSEVKEGRTMFFWYSRDDMRVIEYDAPDIFQPSVLVANQDDGRARFGQSIWVSFPEEQDSARVAAALQTMTAIERSVEASCGVALRDGMRTHCRHVPCRTELARLEGK